MASSPRVVREDTGEVHQASGGGMTGNECPSVR